MTSSKKIVSLLLRDKSKAIGILLLVQLLLSVGEAIFNTLNNKSDVISLTGGGFAFTIVGFVMISTMNERVYSAKNYRMLPISDNKLYSANILTSILTLIVYFIGEFLIFITAGIIFPNPYDQRMIGDFIQSGHWLEKSGLLVAILLATVLILVGITLIHLVIDAIENNLPTKDNNGIKVILTIVVIWLFLMPFNFITANILRLSGINQIYENADVMKQVLFVGIGIEVVWIALFVVLGLYFLRRWSEPIN